jgi:hypothetical protein
MERDESQKITVAKRQCPDSLAHAKRVHFRTVWRFDLLNCLSMEARVTIQGIPTQLPQAAERRDNLFQFGRLKAEEYIQELGTVEIQANTATGRHANAPRFSTFA